jgi:hypothetical protein
MKDLIIRLLIGAISFLLIYLLGAFYSKTFDISKWTELIRGITGFFGGFALALSQYLYKSKNK